MTRSTKHGVPTRYNHVNFRSRLEARYAAFFDQMRFPWTYEPPTDDLASGWLPDFLIGHVLIECKPALTTDALEPACTKVERSGYKGHVVIFGLNPLIALSGSVRGAGTIWRKAGWSRPTNLAWAIAGNMTQWKKVRPGNAPPTPTR